MITQNMGATSALGPDVIDPHIKNIATSKQVISMTTTEILYIQWSLNSVLSSAPETSGLGSEIRAMNETHQNTAIIAETGIKNRNKSISAMICYSGFSSGTCSITQREI